MCDIKKLCTCDAVPVGADHWKLEFQYGLWPSWGSVVETRPEHVELAKEAMTKGEDIMGPMPMPMFEELHKGLADEAHMDLAIRAEEDWLNEDDPFDFDYQPFEGDRLMFHIGGHGIAFSYKEGQWKHYPHQAYSQDNRWEIDAVAEDKIARSKAASYLKSKRG